MQKDIRRYVATASVAVLGLLCWVVMFLAATDVWHAAGRPDFWTLQDPPYPDVRAFAYAFYSIAVLTSIQLIVSVMTVMKARRQSNA